MSKEDSEIDLKVSNTCSLCMSGHSEQFVAQSYMKSNLDSVVAVNSNGNPE